MQLITLLAYITSPPIAPLSRATSADAADSARIVSFTAQVAAYKHEDPPMDIAATVWGDAAARAAANIRAGSYWILSGRFKIEKSQPLEFQVEKFDFTLAVNRRSRDDEPDWFNLEIWGKQAQVAADYVRKGSLLGIIGSFKLDRWTDRTTGEERTKPVINVDRLELLGSKRDAEGGGSFGGGGNYGGGEPSEEDVPF